MTVTATDITGQMAVVEKNVTDSPVRDIRLPSGRTLSLITLHNGTERPATFGPTGLATLQTALVRLAARATAGEIQAVGVTGHGRVFAAGADLSVFSQLSSPADVEEFAARGHQVFGALADLPVPSFAFVNGIALGGGLELALHASFRTVSESAGGLGLPEVSLGLVPGWGGTYLLPQLIGIAPALEVVLWNPIRSNRPLTPGQALNRGLVDVALPAVRYLEDSLRWADSVLTGEVTVHRPRQPTAEQRGSEWVGVIDAARSTLDARVGRIPQAPWAALDLLGGASDDDRAAAFRREDRVIAALAGGDQFAAAAYAHDLVRQRSRKPAGAPHPSLATPVTRIGVIGAGLMARQFALLFLRRLQIPVLISDLDQGRVDTAVAAVHAELDALAANQTIGADERTRLRALIGGTTDLSEYAGCGIVIEAVFEDLAVKRQVLAAVEGHLAPGAVLMTNTSSLSVAEIGEALTHPRRLLGFHFFNPVAVMPLIEIVRTSDTDDAALATAFALAQKLGKTAALTTDTPGFVVNRLLAIVFGEAVHALDEGTPLVAVEQAFLPLNLPMTPFQLIDLVGWKVAAHVQDTMATAFPDRFFRSDTLHRVADLDAVVERDPAGRITGWTAAARDLVSSGGAPLTADVILHRVQDALAREIDMMLSDGVVGDARDVDLCMLLGGRWPTLNGGITPYLDREQVSQRVIGATFHQPPIVGTGSVSASRTAPQGAS